MISDANNKLRVSFVVLGNGDAMLDFRDKESARGMYLGVGDNKVPVLNMIDDQ